MGGRMIIPAVLNRSRSGNAAARRSAVHDSQDDSDPALKKVNWDRRGSRRYPLELSGEISTRRISVPGKTVNVSSGGLLIRYSEGVLQVGENVKVCLTGWPGMRHDTHLTLIVEGVIVRSWAGHIAVRKKRYEFTES